MTNKNKRDLFIQELIIMQHINQIRLNLLELNDDIIITQIDKLEDFLALKFEQKQTFNN